MDKQIQKELALYEKEMQEYEEHKKQQIARRTFTPQTIELVDCGCKNKKKYQKMKEALSREEA